MPAVSDFGACGHRYYTYYIHILRYIVSGVAVQARVVHSLALVHSVNDQ